MLTDLIKEETRVVDVIEEDAEERVWKRLMIHCGDPLRERKRKGK